MLRVKLQDCAKGEELWIQVWLGAGGGGVMPEKLLRRAVSRLGLKEGVRVGQTKRKGELLPVVS